MRNAEADLVLGRVIDGNAVEGEPGTKREMPQLGSRRWRTLAGPNGNGVSVEPGVAELRAKTGNETTFIEQVLLTVLLERQLQRDAQIEWPNGSAARKPERCPQRCEELSRIGCARADVLHRERGG